MDATQASVVGGVDAAISAWVAGARNRALGQELSGEEGKLHADMARDITVKELDAWKFQGV